MVPLTAGMLADARATIEASFDKSAAVKRKTATADGQGGRTYTWPTNATYPCAKKPMAMTPREKVVADRLSAETYWIVELPYDADVRVTDRIEIDGEAFEVAAPLDDRSIELSTRVVVVDVD